MITLVCLHKAPQGPFKQECAGMMKKEQNWLQQNEVLTSYLSFFTSLQRAA